MVLAVLACATYFTVQYVIWPKAESYKSRMEAIASAAIGKPLTIKTMRASWAGFNPLLTLEDIEMRDAGGQVLLSLPRVTAVISWWSLPVLSPRFHQLDVVGPELDIRRDEKGDLYMAGLLLNAARKGDSQSAQWLLKQDEILVRDARLRWRDHRRRAPDLNLDKVQLRLRNVGRSHLLALSATPPARLSAPLEVQADFSHPFLASDIAAVRQWNGVLTVGLQEADLAAWKAYVDYPVELHKGFGSVRASLTMDEGRVAAFSAALSVRDVVTRLGKNLDLLNLDVLRGRIEARGYGALTPEKGALSLGGSGHRITLRNLSLRTREGLVLPETTVTQEHMTPIHGAPARTFFRVSQMDLETLSRFARYVPLTADMRKMLADLSPKGTIKDFELAWQGSYPRLQTYRIRGEFAGLTLKSQAVQAEASTEEASARAARIPGVPGVDNVTGRIHANQSGGNIELDSRNLSLHFPGLFKKPAMHFDLLKTRAEWAFKQQNRQLEVVLGKTEFVHEGITGSLEGKHIRPLDPKASSAGYLELKGEVDGIDVKRLDQLLPTQTPEGTRRWLTGGIEAGYARDIRFRVKGDLADFPFPPNRPGNRGGEFFVTTQLQNATLNYAPGQLAEDGRSPLWPKAEKIQGQLTVRGSRMDIWARTAQTADVALTNVSAIIPDMLSEDVRVEIEGHAAGSLAHFLRYIKRSPVDRWIGRFTENTRGTGNAKLHLQLSLPVNHLVDARVQGRLTFEDNDVKLLRDLPSLSKAKGELTFSEKGFALRDIRAGFLGGAARISGGTQADGKYLIKATGDLTMDAVRKEYPGVMARIKGKTDYRVSIREAGRQPDIEVASNLRGIILDFPAPLAKSAQETLDLKVRLTDRSLPEAAALRDQIDIALGKHLSARYLREKAGGKMAHWRVLSGGIGFDAPPPEPHAGVAMRLVVGPVNADEWKRLLATVFSDDQRGSPAAKAGDGVLQYFTPTRFAIKTPRLRTTGLEFDQVELQLERKGEGWQADIASRQATGRVHIAEEAKEGYSKIVARLSSLTIPEAAVEKTSHVLEALDRPAPLPNLDVVAENFQIYGKNLGKLALVAANVPGTSGRRWNISKLHLLNAGGTLKASGRWVARKTGSKTRMRYVMELKNAGDVLTRLGFKNVLRDGAGRLAGTLQWTGSPFALDKPSLGGRVVLSLKKGQFLPADPGVAKLLNVLSLQSVPRRLLLDFRDVFSKGYAFDTMTATATISKGVLTTHNLKMSGVGMAVMMAGQADVVKETQDLHLVVIPELDASAASLAAMVVNPVIGVGTFLAQMLLKDPLKKAMTFEYQVTGSWAEPTVTKIERKQSEAQKGLSDQQAP